MRSWAGGEGEPAPSSAPLATKPRFPVWGSEPVGVPVRLRPASSVTAHPRFTAAGPNGPSSRSPLRSSGAGKGPRAGRLSVGLTHLHALRFSPLPGPLSSTT